MNFNKGKMKAAWVISFFSWETFWQDFRGEDKNLDSDWLAQTISIKMKCRVQEIPILFPRAIPEEASPELTWVAGDWLKDPVDWGLRDL